ncbi:MAG: argininosuccinate lyase [Anaeromicrobium sp.]|jgi:argininosuccinate lyase|uniref:argininosuccinate lyase n=1 Tax=Anaeromicrobium sp. TaxID=1929132 RepID=UPI0025D96513|nr:argininosuccinate lyase [Anaeromicrobium sp.]MCT4593767.1 argininosuccinate lyase [Anaeromicrobium sp.]
MKLWGGRFKEEVDYLMNKFNSSLPFDKRLFPHDIKASIAHVTMLCEVGILSNGEKEKIVHGLKEIKKEVDSGDLKIEGDYEDIHSFIELNLIDKIGPVGKKVHTARSRNDQVAVAMKLFAKEETMNLIGRLNNLNDALKIFGDENNIIMAGYTHLQRAQTVTLKYHMMAYYQMFKRDIKRLQNSVDILNESPLGCCALAGTTYDIDRDFTAHNLGFKNKVANFLDGISDRDYIIELISDFSIIMMHLSRLSEEIIMWSSQEFKFITLDDKYSTGSSIMPQKKNPDGAELIRGKTGRVYGSLMSILTTMKALPLAYNKDMQEDKEQFFDALDTVSNCVVIMTSMIKTMKVNEKNLKDSVKMGFLNATEVADYLVNKGISFRDAHEISGNIVLYCEEKNIPIEKLCINEFKNFNPKFEEDIYDFIDYEKSLEKGIKKEILQD